MADQLRSLTSSAGRFALVGASNTAVTGLVLAGLATVIDRRLAYVLVYAAGLAFVVTTGPLVYGGRWPAGTKVAYAGVYLLAFLIGLSLVSLTERWGMPPGASGLVVLVTAPITFLAGRALARRAGPELDPKDPS